MGLCGKTKLFKNFCREKWKMKLPELDSNS